MGKPKIKDLSKHVTAHTCSKCSTIYCEYSEELVNEYLDCFDNLLKSTVDVAKDVVRRIEQEYTEDDMISFADYMSIRRPGGDKEKIKQWEDQK